MTNLRDDNLERRPAFFTHREGDTFRHYYFAPADAGAPVRRFTVEAAVDVAADGTLAGIEFIDTIPPPQGDIT